MRTGLFALAMFFASSTLALANVPVPIYRSEPGYDRARWAATVAPWALGAAALVAVVFALRGRSLRVRVTAILFGTLAVLGGAIMRLGSAGTVFFDEEPPRNFFGLRQPGSPRPMTPDESLIVGLVVLALICGGIAFARRRGPRPGSSGAASPPPSKNS